MKTGMSIYKSIVKNYAASSFGMGINFLNQIVMVPLFILFWGIDKYADWILITAFSSFFTMSDLGLNTVTTNEFVIKYQQKEHLICLKLLINAFLFVIAVGIFVILLGIGLSFFIGFKSVLQVSVFSESETSFIFILLLFQVFFKMYSGVYNGIFRVTSQTHISLMIGNIVRLIEVLILLTGVLFKLNIFLLMFLYILPACMGIIYNHIYSRKWFTLNFSFKLFDGKLLKSFIKPSLAFMLTPLGWAVSNQGMIFVVNSLLGSVILVTFTTARTLVYFLRSLMGLLAGAIWPEVSVSYGKKELRILSALYRCSFIITGMLTLICIIALIFIGKPVYLAWTRHEVLFYPAFFYGMLAVLFVSCLWGIASVIPLATNNHESFSIVFLITQITGIMLTYIALSIVYPHLSVIPIILFFTESLLLCFVIRKVNLLLDSNLKNMLLPLYDIPVMFKKMIQVKIFLKRKSD